MIKKDDEAFEEFLEDLVEELQKRKPSKETSDQAYKAKQDLIYTIQDLAKSEELDEETLRNLARKIRAYLERLYKRGDISWEEVEYHKIIKLRDPDLEWKPIKIRAQLWKMTEPVAVPLDGQKHLMTQMTFREVNGSESIDSIPTINTSLIKDLAIQKRDHYVFDVLGTVILTPTTGVGERFQLMVHDIRTSETPLQMAMATESEIERAKRTLRNLERSNKSIYDHILETLIKIQGLEETPELMDSLQAIIVQAFSDGWVNNASGKLHTLIIGAPASGKKLLTGAAKALNSVFQEAQPSKATAAGVCSTAKQKGGTWTSKPGYLPLAHRGVFAIQDFNSVKNTQREKLLGIFNMVMEDGKVIDSTAARQTHPALTSIHLDTNKRTDLFPESKLRGNTIVAKRLDDVRMPMTILSRFDFIIDIPRNAQRQIDVALAMYDRSGSLVGTQSPDERRAKRSRELQVLVALLRTKHENIEFPSEIRKYMQSKQKELSEKNEEILENWPWLSDFQARLTNSVYKFSAAFARMNNRATPTKNDVNKTFKLIRRKFEFIATLGKQLQLPKSWGIPEGEELDMWMASRFAGQQVKSGEIMEVFKEKFGVELKRRTLNRHLPNVARKIRRGLYEFPPQAED